MHPEYDGYGSPETKLIEECAEVIHAITKYQRFGQYSKGPLGDNKLTNREVVLSEIADLERRIKEWKEYDKAMHAEETR
jgi:hypothetical protein